MSLPIPPFAHAPSRAAAIVRAARTRLAAATTTAGLLAAGGALLLAPRPAHASPDTYQMCLDAVHALATRCLDNADNPLGDLACMWAGGAGYLACAALEAIRQIVISGGLNIT